MSKKTIGELVINSIINKTEFSLLNIYHKTFFETKLSNYYINKTLDLYNSRKEIGVIASTRLSLLQTIHDMTENYKQRLEDEEDFKYRFG